MLRLAVMWSRAKKRQLTSLLVGVSMACLVMLYIILNAFALSGPQVADEVMANHEYQIGIPGTGPGLKSTGEPTAYHDLKSVGARNITTQIVSSDMSVDGARTTGLDTGLQTVVEYGERPHGIPSERVFLKSGHLPDGDSEVALSTSLRRTLGNPSVITVFSGSKTLKVVGTVEFPYATDALEVYGGNGLWRSLPKSIHNGFPEAASIVEVSWDGLSISHGASVLSRISGVPVDSLITESKSRSFYLSSSQRSLTQRTPGLFTYPSLGLMALAGIVMVGMLMPALRAETGAMTKLGVPKRPILAGVLLAIGMLVLSASLVGFLAGVLLGWLARLWVVPHLLTQPISPLPPLPGLLLRLCIAGLMPALISALAMSGARSGHRSQSRVRKWVTGGRRVVVAGSLVWCLYRLAVVHSIEDALMLGIVMTMAALLVLPDVVHLVVRIPLPGTVNGRIAGRLVRTQVGRVTTVAMLLCGCLALPCSLTVLVSSVQVSNAAQALIPKGQLSLQDSSGTAPPAPLVQAVEAQSGMSRPVTVGRVSGAIDGSASNAFGVIVVSSIDDLARLNDAPIDASATKVLEEGGLLDISGAKADLTLVPDNGRPRKLPTARMQFQSAWAQRFGAVMLQPTATSMKLGVQKDAYVYTGVTDHQIDLTKKAVFAVGGDPRVVTYHIDPEPPPVPWEWWLAVGALSAIALLATFVSTRSLGADLRQHSAQFLAIGLPPATGRWVLAAELGVLVVATVPLTVAVGILPTALVAAVNKGLELSVPTGVLAMAAGVLLGAVAISGAGAMAGVTARERTVDALV